MANIVPITSSFLYGYWRPWKEDSNYFTSFYNYVKDVSLAKYQADTVGQYISQASAEQIKAIGQLGFKIGLAFNEQVQAIGELGDRIEIASNEQVQAIEKLSDKIEITSYQQIQAISKLGDKLGMGLIVLHHQMASVNEELTFMNKNLVLQIEQQKSANLLLDNIGELLRVPDSEKERQHSIELGLKFFVNAQKDEDLFEDALGELLKAEEIMKQDYFVLHRIGLIYLYSIQHINPQKALDYFTRAAKYASVESDPKAARLANVLAQYGTHVDSHFLNDTTAIETLAADSFEKAAFAAYVLGNFEFAVKQQTKALKYNNSSENYFMLAKYQTRTKQIDLCIQNLNKSIEKNPIIVLAVFKDLDLVNEPEVLKMIEEKNDIIDNKIQQLITDWESIHSDLAKIFTIKLKDSLQETYDKKVKIKNLAIITDWRNWTAVNLDVSYFKNGDSIPEANTFEEWETAGNEEKPAWCYYDNNIEYGKIYGKLYNWYAVNDLRGLAPEGWHVPSEKEWNILTEFLSREDTANIKIKSTDGWGETSNCIYENGFSALPGGICLHGCKINFIGGMPPDHVIQNNFVFSFWWSSTSKDTDSAMCYKLSSENNTLDISTLNKRIGMYVRCLKN